MIKILGKLGSEECAGLQVWGLGIGGELNKKKLSRDDEALIKEVEMIVGLE